MSLSSYNNICSLEVLDGQMYKGVVFSETLLDSKKLGKNLSKDYICVITSDLGYMDFGPATADLLTGHALAYYYQNQFR